MFYFAGGFVAVMTQTVMTLLAGNSAAEQVPTLGASGAVAAGLGAYFVIYPSSRILTLVVIFPIRISAWIFLGAWFVYQLVEANFGFFAAGANGGGVAFFAHVGGLRLRRSGRLAAYSLRTARNEPASALLRSCRLTQDSGRA